MDTSANNLNQTTGRETLRTRSSGTSLPTATITVDGATATRTAGQRYWDAEIDLAGQYKQIDVVATLGGQTQPAPGVFTLFRPAQETLTYDEEGNLTDDSLWHYTWDAENRLTGMTTSTMALGWTLAAPNRSISFRYDYLGRRVEKSSSVNGSTPEVRRYVYDDWNLAAEIEVNENPAGTYVATVTRSYVWGLDVQGSLVASGGVGALVLETAHTETTLTVWNAAADGNGNITALIDGSGTPVAVYEYDPFGQLLRMSGTEATNNPFRFSSKFQDNETGLLYYGHRYYDANLGRFINRDPIGESGGANLYGFVGNSPINGWDCLGLADTHPNETPKSPVVVDGVAPIQGVYVYHPFDDGMEGNDELRPLEKFDGDHPKVWKFADPSVSKRAPNSGFPTQAQIRDVLGAYQTALGSDTILLGTALENPLFREAVVWAMRGAGSHIDTERVLQFLENESVRGRTVSDPVRLNAAGIQLLIDANERFGEVTGFDRFMASGGTDIVQGLTVIGAGIAGRPSAAAEGRRVPNPGGKLGDAVTRQTAQNVVADLKGRGFTQVRQEVMFEKGPLGVKTRYGDIVATNPATGETVIVNIGKMRGDGVPIMRERQALDDIIFSPSIQQFPNSRIIFIEKGASGLPPGFK